jgi:hypothetical protein
MVVQVIKFSESDSADLMTLQRTETNCNIPARIVKHQPAAGKIFFITMLTVFTCSSYVAARYSEVPR